jgi:hypothetical protein
MALSDVLQNLPNYLHPDYATPGQLSQAREYAKFLMEPGKGQIPVKSWQAGLANALNQGIAGWELGNAQRSEGDIYRRGQDATTQAIAQQLQQSPQGVGPMASVQSAPMPPVQAEPAPVSPAGPSSAIAAGPVAGTPNARVADAFADTNSAITSGAFDPVGANNIGPNGTSPSPYKVASNSPTIPSPAPAPMAAATAAPAASPASPGAAPMRSAQADPRVLGQVLMNPFVPKEAKDYAKSLIEPKPYSDVYGNPGVETVAGGVKAQPVGGGLQPGVRTPTTISPEAISGTTFNLPPKGGNSPQAVTPVMGGAGLGGAMDTMNRLRMNATGTGAVADIAKADIAAANDAPTIKRVAGVMLNDLQTHGDKMTFGPTAEWSNNVKRVAANYAPGFMKDQLESLASADSFDKMSAQLTSLLSKGGGTDAQLFNNMKSVPGAHNSKEGAQALLNMTLQVADQQMALRQAVSAAKTPTEYETLKRDFYQKNPIVNPITGNPISLDLKGQQDAAGSRNGPPVGTLYNGFRFKGGNPKDKSNWEPVT